MFSFEMLVQILFAFHFMVAANTCMFDMFLLHMALKLFFIFPYSIASFTDECQRINSKVKALFVFFEKRFCFKLEFANFTLIPVW